jgi:poly-gamma-glutamate capsule biosynthesis protein CapA/YwtB (metallophosphatase superfamily)
MTKKLLSFVIMACSALGSYAQEISIAMTGDVMMGTTFPSIMLPAYDGRYLFKDAKDILVSADLTVGNLEGTLCDEGESTKGDGPNSYAFRTPTSYGHLLKKAGFDFMSMANNHANDFGLEGIISTERVLCAQGIKYAGLEGRKEYAIIKRNGLKIGLCAFGHNPYTIKHLDLNTVGRIVDTLVARCDVVIVSFHGGAEGRTKRHLPNGPEVFLEEDRGSLRQLAHFCVDHGADVVYGHGPHVTRAIEVYKGRFIAYSLGNFCTPYNVSLKGVSGYAPIVEISVDKQGTFKHGRIHSFVQRPGVGPRIDNQRRVALEMKRLSEMDVPDSQAKIDRKGRIALKK